MAAQAKLTWILTDIFGTAIGEFSERKEAQVTIALNGRRTAQLQVSLEDEAAALIYPNLTRLKTYLGNKLIFNGVVTTPSFKGSTGSGSPQGTGYVDVAAIDQSMQLEAAFWGRLPSFDPEQPHQASADMERVFTDNPHDLMMKLITESNRWSGGAVPSNGIISGVVDDGGGTRKKRWADGKNLWEALVELSALSNAPDFELRPVDTTIGNHAALDTHYPRLGADLTASVIFEHNKGENNVADFSWEPDGLNICNHYVAVGQSKKGRRAPAYLASHAESQSLFGVWQKVEAFPDVKDVTNLEAKAKGYVQSHAFPIDYFTIIPAVELGGQAVGFTRRPNGTLQALQPGYAVPPTFGPVTIGDYWVGDTVNVQARIQPGLDLDLYGRVTDATLAEVDAAGALAVELTLAPEILPAIDIAGRRTEVTVRDAQ